MFRFCSENHLDEMNVICGRFTLTHVIYVGFVDLQHKIQINTIFAIEYQIQKKISLLFSLNSKSAKCKKFVSWKLFKTYSVLFIC